MKQAGGPSGPPASFEIEVCDAPPPRLVRPVGPDPLRSRARRRGAGADRGVRPARGAGCTGAIPARSACLRGRPRRLVTGVGCGRRFACPGEPPLPLSSRVRWPPQRRPPPACTVRLALGREGRPIDLAKALAALIPQEPLGALSTISQSALGCGLPLGAAPLPCIRLPTTAGTGGEVTRTRVIRRVPRSTAARSACATSG